MFEIMEDVAEPMSHGSASQNAESDKETRESEEALVVEICDTIRNAKGRWKDVFDEIRYDVKFANGTQWPNQTRQDMRYVANVIRTHVKTVVSSLYARNPTAIYKRRNRRDFAIWDEKPESLQMAAMELQAFQTGMTPMLSPQTAALFQDIQQGMQRRLMFDGVGESLELMFNLFLDDHNPNFKSSMKQLVRRAVITGVGWLKFDFRRTYDKSPEAARQIHDHSTRLDHLENMMKKASEGELQEYEAEAEEGRQMLAVLNDQEEILLEEGVLVSLPRTTNIILDAGTTNIKSFEGTGWMAEEFMLDCDEIQEIYKVDIKGDYTPYDRKGTYNPNLSSTLSYENIRAQSDAKVCVWEFYNKKTGLKYVVADGYKSFLQPPSEPNVRTKHFFPYIPLVLNETEEDDDVYPRSDVRELRHPQREYNRSKESLRQHRIAKRPVYGAYRGSMDDEDNANLAGAADHDIVFFNALKDGQKIQDIIQEIPSTAIDPNVYETGTVMQDFQRIAGGSEATLTGAVGGGSATENAIASQTTQTATSSGADEIDDFLSLTAEIIGATMLEEYDAQTVKAKIGPGAVWPDYPLQEIVDEIYLRTEAGSSGRPNQAQEIAKWERLYPILIQIPGIRPDWAARKILRVVDENINLSEAYLEGLPSLMTMNRQQQAIMKPGQAGSDQSMQAENGGENQARAAKPNGGPQPADTSPMGALESNGVV